METITHRIRPARPEDGMHLAHLINFAGEGMPYYFWSKLAEPGQDPWEIGKARAQRPDGSFSYKNAFVISVDNSVAACLITYSIGDETDEITPDTPAMFVPLIELENLALSTQYVSVLAAFPEYRGKGFGSELLKQAEAACTNGQMSIIVSDANNGARRLYEKHRYKPTASRPIVKEDWKNPGENWILMKKTR